MDQDPNFAYCQIQDSLEISESSGLGPSIPWTAARCHRLLRPLTSKLALLRKEKGFSQRWKDISTTVRLRSEEPDDSQFSGTAPRKRLRRTYSARAPENTDTSRFSKGRCKEPNGEQWQASPTFSDKIRLYQLRQITGQGHRAQAEDGYQKCSAGRKSLKAPKTSFKLESQIDGMTRIIQPERWLLIKGLYSALDTLLKATASDQARVSPGSLFSTCLRKTPEHIIEEQRLANFKDPDNHLDISAMTYNDLEAFGSVNKNGWKPLREIVRAHGIRLLGNAVADGLTDHLCARGLTLVCMQNDAYPEAEMIVQAMLGTMKPLHLPSSDGAALFSPEQSHALYALYHLHGISKRHRFFYAQLARLFSQRIVPFEWISSRDMIKHWNMVLVSIGANDENAPEALQLLRSVILRGSPGNCVSMSRRRSSHSKPKGATLGQESPSYDNAQPILGNEARKTADRLLGIMTAGAVLNENGHSAVNTLMSEFCMLSDTQRGDHAIRPDPGNLILSALLCTRTLPQNCELVHTFLATTHGLKSAAAFVCSVARYCWLGHHPQAFNHIQGFIEALSQQQLTRSNDRIKCHSLADVGVMAAFDFSEATNVLEHLEWAKALRDRLSHRLFTLQHKTPSRIKRQHNTGALRWEEGINEWVTKTPSNALSKSSDVESLVNIADEVCSESEGFTANSITQDLAEEGSHLQVLSPCATKLNTTKRGFNGQLKQAFLADKGRKQHLPAASHSHVVDCMEHYTNEPNRNESMPDPKSSSVLRDSKKLTCSVTQTLRKSRIKAPRYGNLAHAPPDAAYGESEDELSGL